MPVRPDDLFDVRAQLSDDERAVQDAVARFTDTRVLPGIGEARAKAIVKATAFYNDPEKLADASRGLGEAMVGINVADLPAPHRLAERGW